MTTSTYHVGDVHEVLATLPDDSVDLVLTSPPFLALRSYLPADHPDKAREIGSEATPGEFIDALLGVVEACARVLAPHGSLAFELGDTYSAGAKSSEWTPPVDGRNTGIYRETTQGFGDRFKGGGPGGDGWPLAKSLALVPESFRWALAYGRNPFTGRTSDPWRVRNVVRWVRPNPPVGALGDKYRPATSEMVVACKSDKRWFDLDAVRTEHQVPPSQEPDYTQKKRADPSRGNGGDQRGYMMHHGNAAGAPPLDWWNIPTQPYKGSHYATWPEQLCVRPILSMCPRQVCTTCGEPRRRIVDAVRTIGEPSLGSGRSVAGSTGGPFSTEYESTRTTVGWSDCGHDTWRQGVVLDPFAGSGTTLKIATGHGRDAIGIDLDARNADLARQRVGMWLEVIDHHADEAVG